MYVILTHSWQPIINYVEDRFDEYLNAETKVNRKTINDDRVHCCIYFISPTGHGLASFIVTSIIYNCTTFMINNY